MVGADHHVTDVAAQVIDAVRHRGALGVGGELVVEDLDRRTLGGPLLAHLTYRPRRCRARVNDDRFGTASPMPGIALTRFSATSS